MADCFGDFWTFGGDPTGRKSQKPVQRATGGVLVGLCALLAVNVTGAFTGVSLPLSPLAIGVAGTAGLPGVTLLLLLNLLLGA